MKTSLLCACSMLLALLATGTAVPQETPAQKSSKSLVRMENAYADFNDAAGAVALIDSDPGSYPNRSYAGTSRSAWQRIYVEKRLELMSGLHGLPNRGLPAADARAIRVMRAAVEDSSAKPDSLAPVGHCRDAQRQDLQLNALQQALYACFAELANNLRFENGTVTRVAAFDLLTRMAEPQRRKSLFLAFVPLWQSLNGADEAQSPYRRMIRMAAAQARKKGSPIDAAARTVGVSNADTERWLERILETWREVSGDAAVEPWDYRFQDGAAERELGEAIPREALQPLNQRYYLDLGLDLATSQVIYDLEPRPGKAPLAYTEYIRRGRLRNGTWQPTLVRVSASYERGGLGPLNELVHENGHAAHMLALRTRPAFMDLGDPIFFEAFADVPSWSVYEPAWQQKYLGRSVSESASLQALYSGVMLDVAWALFDLRMLRDPDADPNSIWTDITSRYLHIKPHPQLAWWAVRVQLVDAPGYMVNYGLGAVITADIRQRIAQQLGPFQTGDARWYSWLCEHLLKTGEEQETAQLLRQFLGRPVSPQALLAELRRMAAAQKK
ncbi:MAG: M3 family metallopeptidase [Steroidobacteraceae bacterium]